jgi:hypothetical protein
MAPILAARREEREEKGGIDERPVCFGRKFDIATTSVDSLPFGHGKHSCPGRYFAACELKLILAHLVMNYDVKLENDGVRPQDMWVATNCVPNPNAKVFFRRRAVYRRFRSSRVRPSTQSVSPPIRSRADKWL